MLAVYGPATTSMAATPSPASVIPAATGRVSLPSTCEVADLVHQQPDEQDVEVAEAIHREAEPTDVEQRDHDHQHGDHANPEAGVQAQRHGGQRDHAEVGAEEPQWLVEQPAERAHAHSPGPVQEQPQHRHDRDVQPGRRQDAVDTAVHERGVPLPPAQCPLPTAPVGESPDEEEQGDDHEQPRERPHRRDLMQGAGLDQPSSVRAREDPADVGHEPVPDHHGDDAPAAQEVDEAIPAPGLHAWNGTRRGRSAEVANVTRSTPDLRLRPGATLRGEHPRGGA